MLTPVPGITVAGKYRIVRALGEGGMGAVFEAEHVLTLKRAAIKWVHPRLRERDHGQARLLKEARATSRIRHRNVVQLYDVMVEGGAIFLVMELLEGELLSQCLAREPLAMWQLIALLLPAMEGVDAAHRAGVVHRDIKPENIYLARSPGSSEPVPKVIDFGISKTFDDAHGHTTRSGMALGTPRYAAYEQLRGARDIDGRVDVYAFGVILYEALAGRAPYLASTFAQQAVHFVTTAPPSPKALRSAVPAALDALVQRAIAREREQRVASVAELAAALAPFARAEHYPFPLSVLRRGEHPLPEGGFARDVSTHPYSEIDPSAARDESDSAALDPDLASAAQAQDDLSGELVEYTCSGSGDGVEQQQGRDVVSHAQRNDDGGLAGAERRADEQGTRDAASGPAQRDESSATRAEPRRRSRDGVVVHDARAQAPKQRGSRARLRWGLAMFASLLVSLTAGALRFDQRNAARSSARAAEGVRGERAMESALVDARSARASAQRRGAPPGSDVQDELAHAAEDAGAAVVSTSTGPSSATDSARATHELSGREPSLAADLRARRARRGELGEPRAKPGTIAGEPSTSRLPTRTAPRATSTEPKSDDRPGEGEQAKPESVPSPDPAIDLPVAQGRAGRVKREEF